jgi:hypothetical protein
MNEFFIRDPSLSGVLVEPQNLSQTVFRIGMSCRDLLPFHFQLFPLRLQYMRQIAGDDSVGWHGAATPIRSTQWGKDWLNVGTSVALCRLEHFRVDAYYDFDLGRNASSHCGSIMAVTTW